MGDRPGCPFRVRAARDLYHRAQAIERRMERDGLGSESDEAYHVMQLMRRARELERNAGILRHRRYEARKRRGQQIGLGIA